MVELLIGMAILAILLAVGLPSFALWSQNARIRTTAAGIQNGLQLARAEAVRRNVLVRFQLTDTPTDACVVSTTGTSWVVSIDNPVGACGNAPINEAIPIANNPAPRIIQVRPGAESGTNIGVTADNATAIFNGLGRLSPVVAGVAAPTVSIDVTPAGGDCSNARCLRVTVSLGGLIRLCDPNLPNGDPQRC